MLLPWALFGPTVTYTKTNMHKQVIEIRFKSHVLAADVLKGSRFHILYMGCGINS
jgi:hypothetical protein